MNENKLNDLTKLNRQRWPLTLSIELIRFSEFDRFLSFVAIYICTLSETKDDSSGLEEAQKNQKKAGAAENDPETTGPAENLRESSRDGRRG